MNGSLKLITNSGKPVQAVYRGVEIWIHIMVIKLLKTIGKFLHLFFGNFLQFFGLKMAIIFCRVSIYTIIIIKIAEIWDILAKPKSRYSYNLKITYLGRTYQMDCQGQHKKILSWGPHLFDLKKSTNNLNPV